MRREKLYLNGIVEVADAIQLFLRGVSQDAFLQNDLIRSAVLQKLTIPTHAIRTTRFTAVGHAVQPI
jgi:uncharacterized protein with HEPN domain